MTEAKLAQNDGQNEAIWLEVALDAARAAGELAKKGWRKHPVSTHKGRIDLVTQFDLDSEKLLRERLGLRTRFPVVGEEGGGERAKEAGGLTWYVDPIDGTTNFVHGHPFWCVSVGLFAGSTPVVGVVVAPSLGVEWLGIAGLHATRNGEVCTVSTVDSFRESLLATGFPYDRHVSEDNNFDAFVAIKKQCQAVRRCGSAAIDMCFVADGTYDGYWEKKVKPWDVAAGSAIVLAAGGKVTDYEGKPSDLANGQMVATNGHIHGSLIAELNAIGERGLALTPDAETD
ncbi:MAG TPA: inositol monophosphatase family protein [Polyangiaceae bacterium]|jgi:myo-inositol-1(or 4)-monophosphatase|nr:inositol monophosphatase family protein [Polyangiaceae bacterium]